MQKKYPFYIKFTIVLLGLTLLIFALSSLRDIFIPLAFALLVAILLNPVVTFAQRYKVPHVIAITISLALAFAVVTGIAYFLSSQIMGFSNEMPAFQQKLGSMFAQLQAWGQNKLGISMAKQAEWIKEAQSGLKPLATKALGTVLGSLTVGFLVPVYTFLFLYYKTLILNFLYEVFAEKNMQEVDTVLHNSKGAVQQYMIGLVLEGLIVAALNVLALFILGVKYALLLGIIGAILNVLPYIGGLIAILLPVLIATVTKDGFNTQIGIIVAYAIIQFVDNHFLIPWVVSSKVKINALISIVVVLFWGYFWGISGMFLSIPFTGVLKIIFDRIPDMKPWGKLLGDEIPFHHKGEIWNRRKRRLKKDIQVTSVDNNHPETNK